MSGLHRATSTEQVLELARRLAEDYPSIPLPEVSRVVQRAADTTLARREDRDTISGVAIHDIEVLARQELNA